MPLGPARQQTVLAVLLTELGTPVSFGRLIDRVWGNAPPQRARQTLHTYLSRLRSVLAGTDGQPLVRRGQSYAIEVDPAAVDLHRFRILSAQARGEADDDRAASLWAEALGLWQGAPFADLDSDWLAARATALEAERLAAALEHNDIQLRRGEHARLLPALMAAADAYPLDERLAGQLMLGLYRCERQADALAHYLQLRTRLTDELGHDPGQALQELHQRILRQDPSLAVTGPGEARGHPDNPPTGAMGDAKSQMPADMPGFTGREDALRQLDTALRSAGDPPSTVVIATIGGGGGIGKTTLAVHWAHRARDRFPDGQLYLNLRGFDPGGRAMPVDEALRALLELLQVPPSRMPSTLEGQAGMYRGLLSGSRMLVVLDNARDADHVRPLLPGSPGSTVVVTSRDQMAGLVAAEGARPIRLDALEDGQARQLLANRLGLERIQAEPEAVSQIIAACGGLPLALAIVAARAATRPGFPMAAFAAELADVRGRLDALAGADRATDLRAVFSWSYQALRQPAARLFRLLSLHYGQQIGIDAAASLAGTPQAQVRWLLTELAGAHLLTERAPGRYAFHDLVRAYAAELAESTDEASERDSALARLFDHYLHTGHRAATLITAKRPPKEPPHQRPGVVVSKLSAPVDANTWFGREWETLLATVQQAAAGGHHVHCWQIAWTIADYLERRGRWLDGLACNHTALDAARRLGDPAMQAVSLLNLALHHTHLRQYPQAHTHLREALHLRTAAGDQDGLSKVHMGLALVYDRQGCHADALRHSELALPAAQAVGNQARQVACLNGIAWQHAQLGNYDQCIAYGRQALAVPIEPGNRFRASTWDTLGYAYHRLAQYQQAVASYQRAVASLRELEIRFEEARSLARLADSHDALGEDAAARDARRQALGIFDDLGHPDATELRKKLE